MKKQTLLYLMCIIAGLGLGWMFPLAFVMLDLKQLGETIGWEQISFVTRSQDIYLFSFLAFPLVFSTLFISFINVLKSKKELIKTHELLKQEEKKTQLNSRLASLGVLSAGIGHEINNPLSILILNGELLERKIQSLNLDIPDLEKRFSTMKRSAGRIEKIVQGLRMMAREDGNEKEVFDCNDLVEKAVDMVQEIYLRSGVKIICSTEASNSRVSGSVVKFQQVLMNLLSNAKDSISEYSLGKGGTINVITNNKSEERFVLSVIDDGMGISDSNQQKIYDTFFTTKEVGKGSGMGLSISLSIIKEMGGEIQMHSKEGEGAKFDILIPTSNEDKQSDVPLSLDELVKSVQNERLVGKVLLVEDEAELREMAQDMLRSMGLLVIAASDGEKALKVLEKESFDLVMSDLKMPNMSGEELVLRISQKSKLKNMFIIVVTGGDLEWGNEREKLLIENRIGAILQKPYDEKGLRSVLDKVFGTNKDVA